MRWRERESALIFGGRSLNVADVAQHIGQAVCDGSISGIELGRARQQPRSFNMAAAKPKQDAEIGQARHEIGFCPQRRKVSLLCIEKLASRMKLARRAEMLHDTHVMPLLASQIA